MNFKSILVSVIFISVVMLGCIGFLGGLEEGYDQSANLTGFNRTQERLDVQKNLSDDVMEILNVEPDSGISFVSIPYKMIVGAWSVMKMMFNSIWTLEAVLLDTATASASAGLPFPSWVVSSIIMIIVFTMIIIVVQAFMRWRLSE